MIIGFVLDDTLDRADGVQQAVIAIGEKLRQRGHEVHYVVAETTRTDLKNIHCVSKFVSLKFNGNSVRTPRPASKVKIDKLFAKTDFDVLHVQMPFSPLLSGRVISAAPKLTKVFGTFHILPYNFIADKGTKALAKVSKPTVQRMKRCFAVSPPAKKFMDSAYGTFNKSAVLPNPVDYKYFHSFKKQTSVKTQIVFVGRFEERKGVKQLIEAYAALPESMRLHSKLTMIGKGPLDEVVKLRAKQLNIEVELPGFVSQEVKAQTLANADIAVFPSISGESFGIVLTEAMSAGAGVTIGGNNPGYSSVLEEWPETLFNPKDTKQLTDLLAKMIREPEFRAKIGSSQHEAVKQYDIEVIASALEKAYSS